MALLNKPGVLMYHIALVLLAGTLFLTLKNLNLEEVTETASYSDGLRMAIFIAVGLTLGFGFLVTIASLISKARKNGAMINILLFIMWVDLGIMSLYTFFMEILDDGLTDPGMRWVIIAGGAVIFFPVVMGILLLKFPGKVEEGHLAVKVKKMLAASEKKDKKPYCPRCRTDVERTFKYCPKCGARFSD